jgi:hypothetical protein
MKYTYYNSDSGEIIGIIDTNDADLAQLHLSEKTWINGEYHSDRYYIDQGQPVVKPSIPLDGLDYDFDWATKTWQLNLDKTSQRVRQLRDNELNQVDRVNPVWYNTLTAEQQQELVTYRQSLLDVPQQTGFPLSVIWPAKPTWL